MIYTIGHSNRSLEEFLSLLSAHSIGLLADIRSVPKSRHNPQFNREAMAMSLPAAGIAYQHMAGLGGLRHPRKDSINLAWRNDSFRGYADYMQTAPFEGALAELIAAASSRRTAIMCAESVPWRCHRSLVADALTARGVEVKHIMTATTANPHKLTPFAAVEGVRVTYPGILPPD
ncbi:MAG TPA: DUF488 domain-containing protein [Bryobacteraceae bacterium]|nr:DUF488 domain-containing protein [Bryobacteraceae bacterium]